AYPEQTDAVTVERSNRIHQQLQQTVGGLPGMLTEAQLNELDHARGSDFDRLFLKYMIPHHEGALSMVDGLFGSYGGAQNDFIFKLASDMYADQTTEIEHMQLMLATYPSGRQGP
ncbi:MAG TPA: DUF305 domain-containing protein, partial [Gemmatimonadetes bacterium]|nr:DUF305 domain-containing protein [Gemmatimonadota bacterium]